MYEDMVVMTKPSDLQLRMMWELEEEERRRLEEIRRWREAEEEAERWRRLMEEEEAWRRKEMEDMKNNREQTVRKSGKDLISTA